MLKKVAVLMAVLCLSGAGVRSQSLFSPARNDFESGATLASFFTEIGTQLATADFNLDGNADVVLTQAFGFAAPAATQGDSALVFLGDGRGLFLPPVAYQLPVNAYAGRVVTGDFDDDTYPDFAVAVEDLDGSATDPSNDNGGAVVFWGDGSGGFTKGPELAGQLVEAGFTGIATGQINGDGRDDIVFLNSNSGTFSVFLAQPGRLFSLASGSPVTTCSSPVAAALGALDAAPGLDLAIVCDPPGAGAEAVMIYTGNGGGGFTAKPTPATTTLTDPRAVAIADLNNDGNLDLAIANSFLDQTSAGGTVSLLKGDGVGGFTEAFLSGIPVPVGDSPRSIVAGDVDGDSDQDLLVANWDTDDISILRASITGSGASAQPNYTETFFAAGIRVYDAIFADLDGAGGNLDVLAANANDFAGTLSSYLGGGSDLVQRAVRFTSTGNLDGPNAIAVADFNGDEIDDFAVANALDDSVSVFRSTAGDTAPAVPFALLDRVLFDPFDLPFDIMSADVDGDNDQDLLVLLSPEQPPTPDPPVPGQVVILRNNGAGIFSKLAGPWETGLLPWTMAYADFNGDSFKDLAVTNLGDDTVSVLLGATGPQFTPATPATFSTIPPADVDCTTNPRACLPVGLAAGDLDGDGNTDLALAAFGLNALTGGSLQVFSGAGDGTFTWNQEILTVIDSDPVIESVSHQMVHLANLDGLAGVPDMLAVGLVPDDFVSVYLNSSTAGNFTFAAGSGTPFLLPALDIASPDAPRNSVVTDLNGDGIPDLAVSGIASNNAAVALGLGDGTFSSDISRAQAYGTIKEPNALGAGDFNDDGLVDLVVAGLRLSDIAILYSGLDFRSDINGSGRVDGFDLAMLSRLFGTSVSSPDDFYLDINMDGNIDGLDLVLLAIAFGSSY